MKSKHEHEDSDEGIDLEPGIDGTLGIDARHWWTGISLVSRWSWYVIRLSPSRNPATKTFCGPFPLSFCDHANEDRKPLCEQAQHLPQRNFNSIVLSLLLVNSFNIFSLICLADAG